MAYNDTLFQLGMDLTRSSPAQEEESIDQVQALHGDRCSLYDAHIRSSHLIIDLSGARISGTGKSVERALGNALSFMKASVIATSVRRPDARGWISGSAKLADGEVTVDACLSKGIVAIDVDCRQGLRPEVVMTAFADAFAAREVTLKKQRTDAELARMRAPVVPFNSAKPAAAKKKPSVVNGNKAPASKAA